MRKLIFRLTILPAIILLFIVITVIIVVNFKSNNKNSNTSSNDKVLMVGNYGGYDSKFQTIQAAIDAAVPGDYILVAPGQYYENSNGLNGIVLNKPNIHLIGLSDSSVIISGEPLQPRSKPCTVATSAQQPNYSIPQASNGITVLATNDSLENLTVCNFVTSNISSGGAQINVINTGSGFPIKLNISNVNLTSNFQISNSPVTTLPSAVFGIKTEGTVSVNINNSNLYNLSGAGIYVKNCTRCTFNINNVTVANSFSGVVFEGDSGMFRVTNSNFDNNFSGLDLLSNNQAELLVNNVCDFMQQSNSTDTNSWCFIIKNNKFIETNLSSVPSVTNFNISNISNQSNPGGQLPSSNTYDQFNLNGAFPNLPYGIGIGILGSRGVTVSNNSFYGNNLWALVSADIFVPINSSSCNNKNPNFESVCAEISDELAVQNNIDNGQVGLASNLKPFQALSLSNRKNICILNNSFINLKDHLKSDNSQDCNGSNQTLFSAYGLILNCISTGNCSSTAVNLADAQYKLFGTALGENVSGLDSALVQQVSAIKFNPTNTLLINSPPPTNLNFCRFVPANRWCKN